MHRQLNFGLRVSAQSDLHRARRWADASDKILSAIHAARAFMQEVAPHRRDYLERYGEVSPLFQGDFVSWNQADENLQAALEYAQALHATLTERTDTAALELHRRLFPVPSQCDPANDPSSTLEGGAP